MTYLPEVNCYVSDKLNTLKWICFWLSLECCFFYCWFSFGCCGCPRHFCCCWCWDICCFWFFSKASNSCGLIIRITVGWFKVIAFVKIGFLSGTDDFFMRKVSFDLSKSWTISCFLCSKKSKLFANYICLKIKVFKVKNRIVSLKQC